MCGGGAHADALVALLPCHRPFVEQRQKWSLRHCFLASAGTSSCRCGVQVIWHRSLVCVWVPSNFRGVVCKRPRRWCSPLQVPVQFRGKFVACRAVTAFRASCCGGGAVGRATAGLPRFCLSSGRRECWTVPRRGLREGGIACEGSELLQMARGVGNAGPADRYEWH